VIDRIGIIGSKVTDIDSTSTNLVNHPDEPGDLRGRHGLDDGLAMNLIRICGPTTPAEKRDINVMPNN
jgi:hypothetical protein